jgi:hypothetical protein
MKFCNYCLSVNRPMKSSSGSQSQVPLLMERLLSRGRNALPMTRKSAAVGLHGYGKTELCHCLYLSRKNKKIALEDNVPNWLDKCVILSLDNLEESDTHTQKQCLPTLFT